jgi:hypothetical protein
MEDYPFKNTNYLKHILLCSLNDAIKRNEILEKERSEYTSIFYFLIDGGILEIPFKKCHIDIIKSSHFMDVNLNLGNYILLSIGKDISSLKNNYVYFSISVRNKIQIINYSTIQNLIEYIKELLKK